MENIIKPRKFLMQLKSEGMSAMAISSSDLLEIAELGITIPLSGALNVAAFYDTLKKAVSDFNSDAALSGNPPSDFDDLYTKYCEYIEVLKIFISKGLSC